LTSLFRLPASQILVVLRRPAGREELQLAEAPAVDLHLAVSLLARLAEVAPGEGEGAAIDWWGMPHTDVDAALLALRRLLRGPRIVATARCAAPGCGRRVDLDFEIGDYLEHHAPRLPRGVVADDDEPGWFSLASDRLRFRLPTAADQLAIAGRAGGEALLVRRCLRPPSAPARLRRRAEAAMEALAPSLVGELNGACPECGVALAVRFDPLQFVLRELRERAAGLLDEVHLLASRYGWSEAEILALPHERRARYAELILGEREGA